MGIKATCHCGAQFMAQDELAGRTVSCPTCGQAFQVPLPAPAATFQVACHCGRVYQVQAAMAGRNVRCNACNQQFVVPRPAPTAQQNAGPFATQAPDPFADTGSLGDLGDLSGFDGSLGGAMPAPSYPAPAPSGAAYSRRPTAVRPKRKKRAVNKTMVMSVVFGSLAVVGIAGIALAAFVLIPIFSRYSSPRAVWEAQKKATERQDWKTLYRTMTPETQDQLVGLLVFSTRITASRDEDMAAIMKKHGLESQSPFDMKSPGDMNQMFSQMKEQLENSTATVKNKQAFFVDVMKYFAEKGEEMKEQMGGNQMNMVAASQELKDVVIEGDNARGIQTISAGGRTVNAPIHFRRINGGWLIHQPGLQGM